MNPCLPKRLTVTYRKSFIMHGAVTAYRKGLSIYCNEMHKKTKLRNDGTVDYFSTTNKMIYDLS